MSEDFNPDDYPRTYTASRSTRVQYGFVGSVLIFMGAMLFLGPHAHYGHQVQVFVGCCFALMFVALGVFCMASVFCLKVTLSVDVIEVNTGFSFKRMFKGDIEGIRWIDITRGPDILVLVPKNKQEKNIRIQMLFTKDDPFVNWLDDLADLDAEDFKKFNEKLESQLKPGQTSKDGWRRIKYGRIAAMVIEATSVIACLWGMIAAEPYAPVALLLSSLPPTALLLCAVSKGWFHIASVKKDPNPAVPYTFMIPGIALCICNMRNFMYVDWNQLILPALLCAAAMTAMAVKADPSAKSKADAAVLLVFLSLYGFGLAGFVNTLADQSPAFNSKVTVLQKRFTKGRHPTPELKFSDAPSEFHAVTISLYKKVRVGQELCKDTHTGMLGIQWYKIDICD